MGFRLFAILLAAVVLCVGWAASCVIWRAAEVNELVGPLETRRYRGLTVVAVGTGSPYENPERRGPSTAIAWGEHILLVDVGRGVAEGLRLSKIPVSQPSRVLLTSLMPENIMGLDDLIFTGWRQDRAHPLEIVGPTGTREFVSNLEAAYRQSGNALGDALALPKKGRNTIVIEAKEGFSADWEGLSVRAAEVTDGPLPALIWRFETDGDSVVISGIGWADERLVSFAQGADILVHEAVYVPPPEDVEAAGVLADPERLRREAKIHTSLLEIGAIATKANVATLVLTKMRPPPFYDIQVTSHVAETFNGKVKVPEDGDEITP
jgi:ribonuclease Z